MGTVMEGMIMEPIMAATTKMIMPMPTGTATDMGRVKKGPQWDSASR